MYIRIINGNYGHANGLSVTVKTPKDKPFEVSDSEALRLAGLKVAEIVESPSAKKEKEADVDYENSVPKAADNADSAEGNENNSENGDFRSEEYESGIPKYSAENTNAELLAIAEEYGIDIPAKATKAQIIEALDSYFGDMPVLTAKEPEE